MVPSAPFRFTPPGPGTLTVSVGSTEADMDLLVLGDCTDPATELGCSATELAADVLHVDFAEAGASPALVVVVGKGLDDVGTFELEASFVPAICGDGVIAGPERCDDGGTVGGDGCAADCLAIEWETLCAALPALSTETPNAGDTSQGSDAQDGTGICGAFAGAGLDELWRFTAPHDGTLTVRLDEPAVDHVLYARDGCGPVASWDDLLSCSNSGRPDTGFEELRLPLVEGQSITVVVEGFTAGEQGPYTLEATFQ